MSTRGYRRAVGTMLAVAGVAGAWADPAPPEAAPAGATSNAPPVILFIGNSLTGSSVPKLLTELMEASTPPLAMSGRYCLRGAHALTHHWQRPPQPAKGGSLLSWIRYPDPPQPALSARERADWGERRPDLAIVQPYGEPLDEDTFQFWIGLYQRAMAKRGIQPILYVPHIHRLNEVVCNFMFPFKDEAEGARFLAKVNAACLRAAAEYNLEVAPSYLACYRALKARPDMPLHRVGTPDKVHAGPRAYYLESCTIYGTLFNRSPEGLPVRVAPGAKPDAALDEHVHVQEATLADEEAQFLQKTAWDSILEFRRLLAEHKAAVAAGTVPALAPRPRVLVIGAPYNDAYRRDASTGWKQVPAGYRAVLRERVKERTGAEVIFAPLGPGSADAALAELDDWLGGRTWTLVAFGWGARELAQETAPNEYEKTLRTLVAALKENGSPLLWTGFVPVTPSVKTKSSLSEKELDTLPTISMARDTGPLRAAAAKVLQDHGVAADPEYAEQLAERFAPGGQPAPERPISQEDWMTLGEWLADSLARHVPAGAPADPAASRGP